MALPPDMLAKLDAQRAYFASDEALRERAAPWRDASPEECLAETDALCIDAQALLAMMEPDVRERALAPEPLPPDTEALLIQLWNQRRR